MRLLVLALTASVVFGCSSDYPIWIPRSASADPLYRFVKNGKAGYIDAHGNVVIRPKLDVFGNYGSEFHDGLLKIDLSDGRYIDRSGKVAVDRDFNAWNFSEGLAAAMSGNLWGYIDKSGEFAISPRFETSPNGYAYSFSDGLAMIQVNGKFGFIDHSGEFVIKPQFPDAISFHDGMARVVTDGPCIYFTDGPCNGPRTVGGTIRDPGPPCKFTYIDKSGRVITPERFDGARDFSEGLAPVSIGGLWGFIDKSGKVVIPPKFEDAEPFASGLSRIRQNYVYGYADKSGNINIEPLYKYAEDFSEGLAVVSNDDDRYWYIDEHGNRRIEGEFELASPFFKGLAHVKSHGHFAYIDRTGRRVFTY